MLEAGGDRGTEDGGELVESRHVSARNVHSERQRQTGLEQPPLAEVEHREEATQYALGFARDLDAKTADRFIEMYVNELTSDYGDEGRQAVAELLRRAEDAGAYEQPVRIDFVGT